MNALMAGTRRGRLVAERAAKEIEAEGEPEMSTKEVDAMVELLIQSGRALVPPPDPERVERVWRRLLAALQASELPAPHARAR